MGSALFDVRALLFIVPSGLEQHTAEIHWSVPKITSVFDQATNIFTEVSSYLKSFTRALSQLAASDSLSYTMPLINGKEYYIVHFWSYIRNFQPAPCRGKATWPESVLLVVTFPCAREETEAGLRNSPQHHQCSSD